MDRFSFVMVLLSIIVGLGVTELLTNFARQIQNRRKSTFYWVHTALAFLVFIALLQQWWESWDQRFVETWSFPILLMMLGAPVGLYVISHLLFPEDAREVDFKYHYYQNSRVTYLIGALTVVTASLYRPISFGNRIIDPDNLASALIFVAFLTLSFSKKRSLHHALVPLIVGFVLFDVLFFHMSI